MSEKVDKKSDSFEWTTGSLDQYRDRFTQAYLVVYAVMLAIAFLDTTMWYGPWVQLASGIAQGIAAVLIVIKVFMVDRPDTRAILIDFAIAASFAGSAIFSGYSELTSVMLLILGARHVPFKQIVRLYCIVAGGLLVITIAASQTGLVANLIYPGKGSAFGIRYTTDFGAHLFFCMMGLCYLLKDRLNRIVISGLLFLSLFVYYYTGARTNAICLMLAFLIFMYGYMKGGLVVNAPLRQGLPYVMPLLAAGFISLTVLYGLLPGNGILALFDRIVSGRLRLGSLGLDQYGVRLFGSAFEMVGFGSISEYATDTNIVATNTNLQLLFRFGTMAIVGISLSHVMMYFRARIKKWQSLTVLAVPALIVLLNIIMRAVTKSNNVTLTSNGSSIVSPSNYFFLDSSYALLLVRYGIVLFVATILIFVLISRRAVRQQDYTLVIIVALIALQSMIEHHLIEIAYNPFILALLADMGKDDDNIGGSPHG